MADRTRWPLLAAVTLGTGMAGGIAGTALTLVLHVVQRLAYGYDLGPLRLGESFLDGASGASPERRVVALVVCGVVAGLGWWALYRFGRPLVSVEAATRGGARADIPFMAMTAHALLQIVTVGLGSPLGREAAPRQFAAAVATKLSRWAGLKDAERRTLVACGAGAGLAAAYSVPLGSTVFVLEGLLGTWRVGALVPASFSCAIGAAIAWVVFGGAPLYDVPHFSVSVSLVAYSLIIGPIMGMAGAAFASAIGMARGAAPRDWRLLLWCPLVFAAIGMCAIPFPQVLGNGKGTLQLEFAGAIGLGLGLVLLVLRTALPIASIRAGAAGGSLTPGLAIGALIATLLGSGWNRVCPTVPTGAFAVIGSSAFLAASMRMPITALVLTAEFARIDAVFLLPMLVAVSGSAAVSARASQWWKHTSGD